jgi:hypothetical protein
MKLMLVAVLLLATVTAPETTVRFEADGVRVGSELVTGAAVSMKESGAAPLLVSGSVVESLSGESLTVALDGKQILLGAGLRLARTADGYRLTTHGMRFSLAASGASLAADRAATFKVTEKGFDFGALGALEGTTLAARVTAETVAAVAEPAQQVEVSPEKTVRQGRAKVVRRLFSQDPLNAGQAANSISVRQIPRVTPDGAP